MWIELELLEFVDGQGDREGLPYISCILCVGETLAVSPTFHGKRVQ